MKHHSPGHLTVLYPLNLLKSIYFQVKGKDEGVCVCVCNFGLLFMFYSMVTARIWYKVGHYIIVLNKMHNYESHKFDGKETVHLPAVHFRISAQQMLNLKNCCY